MIENAFKVGDCVRFKTVEEFKAGGRIPDSFREIHSSLFYRSVPPLMQKHLCGETFHISEVVQSLSISPYYHTEEGLEYRRSGDGSQFWYIDDGMLVPAEVADDTDADDIDVDAWVTIL